MLLQKLSRTGSHSNLRMLLLSKAAHHPLHQQDPHYEKSQLLNISTSRISSLPLRLRQQMLMREEKNEIGCNSSLENTLSPLIL